MGARNVTQAEFVYIKELDTRKGLSKSAIRELTGRSNVTLKRIERAATFRDFVDNKKRPTQPTQPQPTAARAKVEPDVKKDYTGALLRQIARLVEAISYNNNLVKAQNDLIRGMTRPYIVASGDTTPMMVQKPTALKPEEIHARRDAGGNIVADDDVTSVDWLWPVTVGISLIGLWFVYSMFVK